MPYMCMMTSSSLLLGAIVCTCSNVLYLLRQPIKVLQSYLMELLAALLQNIVAKTKRLRLMVRDDGVVVGTCADNAWAMHALGVDPTKIIHHSLAHYVDVFTDVSRPPPSGRLTPKLVTGREHWTQTRSQHG